MSKSPIRVKLKERYTTAALLFVIPTLYFLYSLFIIQPHDWDLDAFLYLGSRLDSGELLYLKDFETKLPLVQYLFWIPYHLGGIGAWRIITFAISFSLALISSHVIVQSLVPQSSGLQLSSRKLTALSAATYLTFLYSLPQSLSAQIDMFAASIMYFAIALWHRAVTKKRHANIYILLSGIAAGIAVSVRPNYLFVMPAFFLFGIVCAATLANFERYSHPIKQMSLFAIVSSITIILQFVPYLMIRNGPSTLLSALLSLQSQFSWGSVFDIFHDEFLFRRTVAFYVFMCLSMGTLIPIAYYQFRKHSSDLRVSTFLSGTLLCVASILGLEYSFIKTHYFDHNCILFVPYASVVFTYLWIFVSRHRLLGWDFGKSGIAILAGWYLSVMVVPIWHERSRILAPELNFSINYRNIDPVLADFLHKVVLRGMSFYVPNNAIYHVVLNHERIGDGHPFMLYLVLSGRRIGPIDNIFLYSDTVHKDPCLALWESHKDIIVASENDELVLQCLLSTDSGYKETSVDYRPYRIFAHRP